MAARVSTLIFVHMVFLITTRWNHDSKQFCVNWSLQNQGICWGKWPGRMCSISGEVYA